LAGIALAGVVVCAVLLALAIHSVGGHHRDLIAIFGPVIGAAWIGTGLFAWLRRPDNRLGALMVAVGFTYCLSGLIVTTESWTFIGGLTLIAVPYAILFHILLAFPSGRLETRGNRALAGAAYLTGTAGWWACMLFQDTTRMGFPPNPLLVADEPDLFSALARIRLGIVAALIALLGVVLAGRFALATASQRRALAPVYLSGGLVLALYAVWAVLGVARVSPDLQETLERARVVALSIVPFAFLAGLLRSRVAAAAAMAELIGRLGEGRRRGGLRDALAEALGDPSLELAYWLPEREEWVNAAGETFILPAADSGRAFTPVEHDGERVAVLVYAAPVAEERELVRAVGAAAALALENERLDAELWATVQELRASRVRIVESADAARRQIERDLHDGAQQQLVTLALALRTARSRLDRDPQEAGALLDAAAHDLDAAIRELRELARGIHPAILSDRGLGAALEALAQRMPLPVEIDALPAERFPASLEAAAYFVVAEAITNVVRYADAGYARVAVVRDGDRLVVEVDDDGVGGADPAKGSGLRGLADRVAALDGRLDVESAPGSGTAVRAVMPVQSMTAEAMAGGLRPASNHPAPAAVSGTPTTARTR
jgi:signal transduction histidine kinase